MTFRRTCNDDVETNGEGSFGNFLRSLLAGVPWSERAERQEVLNIARAASRSFRLHNANGRTRVIGEDREDIEVHAAKMARAESAEAARTLLDNIRLIHGISGDVLELEVDIPRRWNRRGHVNLELRVPRSMSADVIASNGKVGIEHLCGAVRARSSNGSVDISDVVGDIEVQTSNAKVCCSSTRGRLVARSSNGKIELVEHRGSIDASTSNGLIRACMDEMGVGGVRLATSNGRIVLELPEEVDAEVDIRVDNGVIRNERPLCRADRDRNGQLRGRLGKGGAPIKLRTSNGSVCLR
jgi:DUF4097 and DUF4098 domain-containing protein YvlB